MNKRNYFNLNTIARFSLETQSPDEMHELRKIESRSIWDPHWMWTCLGNYPRIPILYKPTNYIN